MNHPPLTRRTRPTALHDIIGGAKMYKTWAYLSYQDLISRYRRSVLGPFWIAAVMITQAVALSLVFGSIYSANVKEFLPYVISGLTIINLIGCSFGEGSATFEIYKPLLAAHPLPISFHIFRMYCRNLVVFLHNFVVFICVFVFYHGYIALSPLLLPALVIASIFVLTTTTITATLSLRFVDFKFVLPHIWTIAFYFTPVIWLTKQLPEKYNFLYKMNPVYYILEVLRSQMLGEVISLDVWIGALVTIAITSVVAYLIFATMRKKISLWA